jgi:WhiB family redox-sensing transcriptional regulator
MADGACRGLPPGTMHPTDRDGERQAKAVCAACPVRTTCLKHALDNREEYGVWGGCTEAERHAIVTGRPLPVRTPKPINHGTVAGHFTHRRRGEESCDACREAKRADGRNRYQSRAEVAA